MVQMLHELQQLCAVPAALGSLFHAHLALLTTTVVLLQMLSNSSMSFLNQKLHFY